MKNHSPDPRARRRRPEERVRRPFTNGIVFLSFLATVSIVNLVGGNDAARSDSEQRPLAVFPRLSPRDVFSGVFAHEFDAWVDDHVPGREAIIRLSAVLSGWRGFTAGTAEPGARAEIVSVRREESPAAAGGVQPPPTTPAPTVTVPGSRVPPRQGAPPKHVPPITADAGPREELIREYLILDDRGVEILAYNTETTAFFADTVRIAGEQITGQQPGTGVYLAVIPSQIAFLELKRYDGIGADQRAAIDAIYAQAASVTPLDLFAAIGPHIDEYVYFRTDHHWSARGAYYAYRNFITAVGLDPVPLERYERAEVPGFIGSVYYQTLNKHLRSIPDTVEIFLPFTPYTYRTFWRPEGAEKPLIDFSWETDQNKYQIFISSDSPLAVIECPDGPERTVAVVKDSYGNAFVPFLLPHYREIHIIDPRYFEGNLFEYVRRNPVDDVLFINSYAVIADAWGYARNLERITGGE